MLSKLNALENYVIEKWLEQKSEQDSKSKCTTNMSYDKYLEWSFLELQKQPYKN